MHSLVIHGLNGENAKYVLIRNVLSPLESYIFFRSYSGAYLSQHLLNERQLWEKYRFVLVQHVNSNSGYGKEKGDCDRSRARILSTRIHAEIEEDDNSLIVKRMIILKK